MNAMDVKRGLLLVGLLVPAAWSFAQGVDTNAYTLRGARSRGTAILPSARLLEPGAWEGSLSYGHEGGAVLAGVPTGNVRGAERSATTGWVGARDVLNLQLAGSPVRRVELFTLLPVLLGQGSASVDSVATPRSGSSALGDLRLGVRYGFLQSDAGWQWAAQAGVSLPTGAPEFAFGEEGARFGVSSSVGYRTAGPWEVNGLVGYQMGQSLVVGDQVLGDVLTVGGAVAYRRGAWQGHLDAVSQVALAPGPTSGVGQRASLEFLAGGRYFADLFFAELAAGVGALHAGVTPQWRVMGALGVRGLFEGEAGSDVDRDGIVQRDDKCPTLAEDLDGFEDQDGCPDLDNDQDGIVDARDACPDKAEDVDGVFDDDGCPEEDGDRDGLADAVDRCAQAAEDFDNFEDDDGCPEAGSPNPSVRFRSLALLEQAVWFETGKAHLNAAAEVTLREVARVLLRNEGHVVIVGHADDQGSPERNDVLSQRRAEVVRNALAEAGVARERITLRAAGQREPIAATTGFGRSLNRSVTFEWASEATKQERAETF